MALKKLFRMRKKKMAKTTEEESSAINILDSGTVINGDLESTGRLRIDGKIYGSIKAKEKVIIGQTGYVEGEIHCKSAELSGKIKGKVVVNELLSLKGPAKLEGDVFTKKLAIESGAVFDATCKMSDSPASQGSKGQSNTVNDKEKQPHKGPQQKPA